MTAIDRFLRYVTYDTQSDEHSDAIPSTAKQKVLGAALAEELAQMGLHNAHMDEYGYVYAWLPATAGCEGIPCVGLIAHMDTSPDAPGAGVKPRVVRYEGGDLVLNEEKGIVMRAAEFESLAKYKGQELIVTDGTTLLGADDKAGVAEIMSAVEYLLQHPELPHGRIAVGFTPDEEVGKFFIILSSGTNIHIEHVRFATMYLVLIKHRMFGCVHTAYLRAIRNSFGRITGTGTGYKYNLLRNLSVRRTANLSECRTGSRCQTLKLQSGNDIFVFSISIFGEKVCIQHIESCSYYNRSDFFGDNTVLLSETDSPRRT